jgi:hypothetical protein
VLTFEQKIGTSLHTPCYKDASSLARLSISLHRALEVRRTSGNPPNAEVQVDTVDDDDDELTQQLGEDSYSDDDNVSKLIPALIQQQCDDDSDEEDDDDEDNQSMPGLQQLCDDNSSSDDDSVSYQRNFKDENIVDSGASINVITNKVEQINSATVISGMVVPTTKCPDMTDDELKRDKRKVNSEIPSVKKDFCKGW